MSSQEIFETVYRGRQGWLHHASYMRMSKVMMALRALRLHGVSLAKSKVFDYGFGAGTFFRCCPNSAALYGVEQDAVVVEEVRAMLEKRGAGSVDLRQISIANWKSHPLLAPKYDLFLCSHVLEHLESPIEFLMIASNCLSEGGFFLGIVPINERVKNPHHIQEINQSVIERWALDAGMRLEYFEENDHFTYWAQFLYTFDSGWQHRVAQAISLSLGVLSKLCGEQIWFGISERVFSLFSKPTQATFILSKK
jgi:2-polyprenyl-3-methyl-5-hydroxy-6-metoxy-1,4-benzoquinol methylase